MLKQREKFHVNCFSCGFVFMSLFLFQVVCVFVFCLFVCLFVLIKLKALLVKL